LNDYNAERDCCNIEVQDAGTLLKGEGLGESSEKGNIIM